MSSAIKSRRFRNRLLAKLPSEEMEQLAPLLEYVTLPRRTKLETPNKAVEFIYFMESGITSVVSVTDPATEVEIRLIGSEGMTGLSVVLGNHRSPYSSYIQVEGSAQRIGRSLAGDHRQQSGHP